MAFSCTGIRGHILAGIASARSFGIESLPDVEAHGFCRAKKRRWGAASAAVNNFAERTFWSHRDATAAEAGRLTPLLARLEAVPFHGASGANS